MPLLELGQQFVDLLGWVLKVVVDGDDDFTPGRTNAAQQGVVLPVVARQFDATHPCVFAGELLDDLPGVVAAAVLYKNDFKRMSRGFQGCGQATEKFGQSGVGAITGNDYGQASGHSDTSCGDGNAGAGRGDCYCLAVPDRPCAGPGCCTAKRPPDRISSYSILVTQACFTLQRGFVTNGVKSWFPCGWVGEGATLRRNDGGGALRHVSVKPARACRSALRYHGGLVFLRRGNGTAHSIHRHHPASGRASGCPDGPVRHLDLRDPLSDHLL